MEILKNITLYNGDCMEVLKSLPDNAFDLAICDPPYGLDFGTYNRTNKASNGERYKANRFHNGNWDKNAPPNEIFCRTV